MKILKSVGMGLLFAAVVLFSGPIDQQTLAGIMGIVGFAWAFQYQTYEEDRDRLVQKLTDLLHGRE